MRRPLLFLFGLLLAVVGAAAQAAGAPLLDHAPALPLCIEWFEGVVLHGVSAETVALATVPFFGLHRFLPRFEEPNDNGGGTGGGNGLTRDEVEAIVKSKLGAGASDQQVRVVADYAERLAKAEGQVESLKNQIKAANDKLPEGAVVLTGDDAKHFNELKAAGGEQFSLKGVADALKAGTEATQKLAAIERATLVQQAAEAAGVNYAVLKNLKGADELQVAVEGEGDKRQAFAVLKDAQGVESKKPLKEHLESAYPDVKDALFAGTRTPAAPVKAPTGTFPGQTSATPPQGASGDPVADYLNARNAIRAGQKPAAQA